MRPHWQKEMLKAIRPRYRYADRKHRGRILDEFCAVTGYHRKYAIQILNGRRRGLRSKTLGRPMEYDSQVTRALAGIWKMTGFPSSRRLEQLVPRWIRWAREHYELKPGPEARLRRMSVRTMDRRLHRYRAAMKRWPDRSVASLRQTRRAQVGKKHYGVERRSASRPRTDAGGSLPVGGELSRIIENRGGLSEASRHVRPQRMSGTKGGSMALEMKTRKRGDIMVVSLTGEMVIGDEHFELMKFVVKEVKEMKKFVIDLGKVTKMDSAGVGELVALNVAVKENDAEVRLANLDDRVGKILQMALVHKIIPVYDTQKEALASFDE